jgi:hypothetical protein
MVLTNPINAQNVVNRFAQYVVATANSGIVWGTNSVPFGEFPVGFFGGTTAGKGIEINGNNLGGPGALIVASTLYFVLRDEVNRYTRIRLLRARLNVTGGGGNTGSRPTPGIIYDQTQVAHMNTNYNQNVGSPTIPFLGPIQGGLIVAGTSAGAGSGLEKQFDIFRSAYSSARNNVVIITIDVCHASCHSSCHGARGRR